MIRSSCNSSRFNPLRIAFAILVATIVIYLSFRTPYTPRRLGGYVQGIAGDYINGKTSAGNAEGESGYTPLTEAISSDTFNGLAGLCQETEWRNGLWLQCHNGCGENGTSICGGLNNARNRIQTCLRLAIDAGASLILPSTTARDEKALLNTDFKTVCPETFWDTKYLEAALQHECPQLKIRQCDDLTGIDTIVHAPPRYYLEAPYTKGTFRSLVKDVFETANYSLASVSPEDPTVISFGDPYIGWDYRKAEELSSIRKALFKVLKFNRTLLDMSAQILESPQLHEGSFIGVHLRGENDWPDWFGTVDDQMRLYIEEIAHIQTSLSYEVKTVYVSCGDRSAIQIFRDKLEPDGYEVHDKWTLLVDQPDMLDKLEALYFDQKAIVEYQTLVAARFQLGIITSSMSTLIAYARTVDDEEDFFETYVFPGSSKNGLNRGYPHSPSMMGNADTKLMVVSGVDILDAFP